LLQFWDGLQTTYTLSNASSDQATGSSSQGAQGQTSSSSDQSGQEQDHTTSNSGIKSAVVLCPPPAFLTVGFGGDTIQTSTYTAVPQNVAAMPMAQKTALPSIIRQKDKPPRAIFSQLVNYQFVADDSGSGLALTLGTGWALNDGGPGWPFEIIAGPSATFQRGPTLTVAATYGSTNQLQPGYSLGAPIKAKMTPPTFTQNQWGVLIGLSFYQIPTGTKDSGPKKPVNSSDHNKSP